MIAHSNELRGKCFRCGKMVEPFQGELIRPTQEHFKAWPLLPRKRPSLLVEHFDCAARFKGTFTHYIYQPEN